MDNTQMQTKFALGIGQWHGGWNKDKGLEQGPGQWAWDKGMRKGHGVSAWGEGDVIMGISVCSF